MVQWAEEMVKSERQLVMSCIEVQNLPQPERALTYQGCFNCKSGGKTVNVRCSTTLKGEILTDTETEFRWDNIDWKTVYRRVNRLQTRIAKAVECKLMPEKGYERRERYD